MFSPQEYCRLLRTVCLLVACGISVSVLALDDPTMPAYYAVESIPLSQEEVAETVEVTQPLALSSILISSSRRVAIINGKIVKRGEMIMDMRVLSIESGRVLLDNAGERVELHLLADFKTIK